MGAHRLRLTIVASLCGLVCACATGVGAAAAALQFGGSGEQAGQLYNAVGVGLDQETGDLYVDDFNNERVSKFDGSGNFLFAWGWGVNATSPAEESQACTVATGCRKGLAGSGAGEFASACGAQGVAVDNDPFSASYKDVYVEDFCNHRVQKFGPSGNFLLTFGGHVNKTTGGNVCVLGEACTSGTEGAADGELEWAYERSHIAVGPGGAVYVGDKARIQVFEPSGTWRENISLAGLSSTGRVTALAVDAAGDMFVTDQEVSGVRELEPSGTEKATQFDTGSTSVQALAVDAAGDLFVADSSGGFHVIKYDSAGNERDSFGAKTANRMKGVVFSDALNELYVSDGSSVWILTVPSAGPLVESGSESATPGLRGTATLEATVNPEGHETTYHFEYVDDAAFNANGYAGASSTPIVSIGSSFEDKSASANLTKLVPGGTYHYRVLATNSQGTATGPDRTFTTIPPALIDGPWVVNVAGTSATLAARINPLGANTEYRLEYGTTNSYGHTLTGDVGAGESYVPVSYHQQELLPKTIYHYRLVTTSEVGTVEGPDHIFTTQLPGGGELTLPDGRAWELVSPVNKGGASIEPFGTGLVQAASDGSAITYLTTYGAIGENIVGKAFFPQILSRRGAGGWTSSDITIPHSLPPEGGNTGEMASGQPEYPLFSPNLSQAVVVPEGVTPPLSSSETEETPYVRNNADRTYLPLVTQANVPPGTKWGGLHGGGAEDETALWFLAATPDLRHIVLRSPFALTSEAITEPCAPRCAGSNLYEWGAGELQLVDILPDGKPVDVRSSRRAALGVDSQMVAHAISSDGRWIVWNLGETAEAIGIGGGQGIVHLYVRDMVGKKTFKLGGPLAMFQTMSSDGSKVFFSENGDLYEFDTSSDTQTDLTANHGAGQKSAGLQHAVIGANGDGSYIYFVATGTLASGAVGGADNLYVSHYDGKVWATTNIATLSSEDEPSWFVSRGYPGVLNDLRRVTSRVSPNGRYLAFMSNRPLTGYDNIDAISGQPDEEVYVYDATAGHLACASCNPTGARPVGVLAKGTSNELPLVVRGHLYTETTLRLAGSVPGWEGVYPFDTQYQPRYLSDSGRLFFDSPDGLVPQDTNGLEDVYEYEPTGVGSCTDASVTFSERSSGCVSLLSSGTSAGESAFYDASENGDDAFFITSSRLTSLDYDTSLDVYDAHVCSASVPCVAAPVPSPPCTSGDSCKAAPSPQPEIFGPAPSATFSGAGNVVEEAKKSVVKRKTKPKRHSKKMHKGKKARRSRTGKASRKGNR